MGHPSIVFKSRQVTAKLCCNVFVAWLIRPEGLITDYLDGYKWLKAHVAARSCAKC